MARRLDGSGLRLLECSRLRLHDVDVGQGLICVRGGKGGQERTTCLPRNLRAAWQAPIAAVQSLHPQDLAAGVGDVDLPEGLARTFPKAARETDWPWAFPARERSLDPRLARELRHHACASGLSTAVKRVGAQVGLGQQGGSQTLRHQWATPMLERRVNCRGLQDLLGHAAVQTTAMYTHGMARDIRP
jgi:site-specific recombinase XerD